MKMNNVELARIAIPHLEKGNQPCVVNVTSMCGRKGIPAWPEYSASKFALCGLSEALRAELARFGVDVLLMVPGLTRSGLNRHLLRPVALILPSQALLRRVQRIDRLLGR